MRIRIAAACLLVGCSGGDLTLPGSGPQPPASLVILSGDEQRARAGEFLDDPLVVRALDAASQPVPGATVRFGFLDDLPGAGLQPAAVVTDEEGRAGAVVRLGEVTGEQVILARVAGGPSGDLSARFEATALPDKSKDKEEDGNDQDEEDGDDEEENGDDEEEEDGDSEEDEGINLLPPLDSIRLNR
jgi:hypothetical protein